MFDAAARIPVPLTVVPPNVKYAAVRVIDFASALGIKEDILKRPGIGPTIINREIIELIFDSYFATMDSPNPPLELYMGFMNNLPLPHYGDFLSMIDDEIYNAIEFSGSQYDVNSLMMISSVPPFNPVLTAIVILNEWLNFGNEFNGYHMLANSIVNGKFPTINKTYVEMVSPCEVKIIVYISEKV